MIRDMLKGQNWTRDKQLLETTLNYDKLFGDHKITLLGGYSYEDVYYQNSGAQNRQFVTDFFGYDNLQAGENLRPSDVWSGANMNKLVSFFGRATYNYMMKYIVTATVRRTTVPPSLEQTINGLPFLRYQLPGESMKKHSLPVPLLSMI